MSILLRTMMARMAGRLIYEGVITSGDLHIATKDGEAMFFHDSIDFSAYAGTDGGSTPYRFVFTDSAGKTATAYGGAAGGGEALGADVLSGWDLTSGWNAYNCSIDNSTQFTATAGPIWHVNKDILQRGRMYKIATNTTNVQVVWFGTGAAIEAVPINVTTIATVRPTSSNTVYALKCNAAIGTQATVMSQSVEPYTDVPATGLHLMSAKNGTTRNMASVESGFYPNKIVGVKIYG